MPAGAIMQVATGCQDFVPAQALHALLVAGAHSPGLTTAHHTLRVPQMDDGADVVRDQTGGRPYRLRPADTHRHPQMCRSRSRGRLADTEGAPAAAAAVSASPPSNTPSTPRRSLRRMPAFPEPRSTPMHLDPRPGTTGPSPHLRELKDAVRALLGLDDDTAVIIRQLSCSEPGHPPLETVVAVLPMDGEAHRWTLRRPTDQITENDLRATLLHHRPS